MDGGHGAKRAFAHPTAALLRRDLARCGRRVDEVGGELGLSRFRVLYRLLLHRAVAADAVGQRENFNRGIVGDRRQQAEHGGDILLVARDEIAFELAVGALAEDVEGGAAQAA